MSNQINVNINRIVAFLLGGLLMFAVMSFTVVNKVKTQNTDLQEILDISRYEASRLLADAKAQYTAGEIKGAKLSLNLLFENQPGSLEAAEGRTFLSEIELKEKSSDAKGETAVAVIRTEWKNAKALELRTEWDDSKIKFEDEIENKIDLAWEKEKDGIRSEWMDNS